MESLWTVLRCAHSSICTTPVETFARTTKPSAINHIHIIKSNFFFVSVLESESLLTIGIGQSIVYIDWSMYAAARVFVGEEDTMHASWDSSFAAQELNGKLFSICGAIVQIGLM